MDRAHEQGRNLVMEKYAWMMASTAPEQFKKLHHFLIDPTLAGEQWSDAVVKQQLGLDGRVPGRISGAGVWKPASLQF